MEAVEEMVSLGIQVDVVEHNDRLMPRQLDPQASGMLKELMEAKGIALYLGVSTEEIVGENTVEGVRLNNGQNHLTDLVYSLRCETPRRIGFRKRAWEVQQEFVGR